VLPGIPVNVAKRIVAFRKRHGGVIHDWDELLNVNGFPEDRLEEIKGRAVQGLLSGKGKPAKGRVLAKGGVLHHFAGQKARRQKARKGEPV
jgi:Helix-hairpin-helix motif